MIKSAKRAINAILGNADVKDKELLTVFTGVESLLNSRPLTAASNDPNDYPVLTLNHFLIGNVGGELAPETVDTFAFDPRNKWRRTKNSYVKHGRGGCVSILQVLAHARNGLLGRKI